MMAKSKKKARKKAKRKQPKVVNVIVREEYQTGSAKYDAMRGRY